MKKPLIILVTCLACLTQSYAQENHLTVSYSISFPMGDMGDFISPVSFRGVTLDYQNMVSSNIGLGFTAGWNVFYEEKALDTYTVENQSLTGKQYRYSNQVPVLFKAAFYISPDDVISPFVGLGVGTMYSRRNTDMGIYTWRQEAWHFALGPEVGFHYAVGYDNALAVSLQYYLGFQAGNELDEDQSYLALKLGFRF